MQQDSANAKTVVDNTLTDSATIADNGLTPLVGALPVLPAGVTTTLRTTVLPRISSTAKAAPHPRRRQVPRHRDALRGGGAQCKVTFMMSHVAKVKRAFSVHPFRSAIIVALMLMWMLATTAYTLVRAVRG